MIHIALHVIVPLLVALACYRRSWRSAALILLARVLHLVGLGLLIHMALDASDCVA